MVFLFRLFRYRAKTVPPERIDRKVLWFMYQGLRKNLRMTTSSVLCKFIKTPPGILERSIERLLKRKYIEATELSPSWYEVHSLTEKGYSAARLYRWIPW